MTDQYGDNSMILRKFCEREKNFKAGSASVNDAHPTWSLKQTYIEAKEQLGRDIRRISEEENSHLK
jgi:hypothetical protein